MACTSLYIIAEVTSNHQVGNTIFSLYVDGSKLFGRDSNTGKATRRQSSRLATFLCVTQLAHISGTERCIGVWYSASF